jgi:GNAT superfamily N-acetyltransferase
MSEWESGATVWDAEAVSSAANEWAWIPEGAPTVRTADYLVIHYPDWFVSPTTARVLRPARDVAAVIEDAHAIVRGWGRDQVWWVVSDVGPSAEVEEELLRRSAVVTERSDILAIPLAGEVPDLDVPKGIVVRPVTDEEGLRHALAVEADAFDYPAPTAEQLRDGLGELRSGLATGAGGRFVAYLDGEPAGTGGWSPVGEVLRLWGAGTTKAARGQGAYRAVLEARLRLARSLGCTLGLTHGRVDTSSPIFQRVGFTRFGEQRTLRLDV